VTAAVELHLARTVRGPIQMWGRMGTLESEAAMGSDPGGVLSLPTAEANPGSVVLTSQWRARRPGIYWPAT
jgi:hypothetical protein